MKKNIFIYIMIIIIMLCGTYIVITGSIKLNTMNETNSGITLTGTTLTGTID